MYGWAIPGKLVIDDDYLETVPSGIFECHAGCSCTQACVNKVTQSGVQFHLDVNYTKIGWSMYPREAIPAGSFVCLYLGELIDAQVNKVNVSEQIRTRRQGDNWLGRKEEEFYLENKTVMW